MADPHNTILHRWFDEVWNQGNTALIDEFFPPERVAHGLREPQGDAVRGAAEYRAFYERFRSAFPDIHIEIEDSLVDGDRIAVRCVVTGTHTGPGLPVAPTGKPVRFTGMCMVRIEDGRAVEGWNNFDFLAMYHQLGMTLA